MFLLSKKCLKSHSWTKNHIFENLIATFLIFSGPIWSTAFVLEIYDGLLEALLQEVIQNGREDPEDGVSGHVCRHHRIVMPSVFAGCVWFWLQEEGTQMSTVDYLKLIIQLKIQWSQHIFKTNMMNSSLPHILIPNHKRFISPSLLRRPEISVRPPPGGPMAETCTMSWVETASMWMVNHTYQQVLIFP